MGAVNNDITVRNQTYYYQAQRHWLDSETYAFNTTTNATIDRDRFFVGHDQHLVGNNTDVIWNNSYLFGMENRFAAQLQVSRNKLIFSGSKPADFPRTPSTCSIRIAGSMACSSPTPMTAGSTLSRRRSRTVSSSTPMLALIGGVRVDDFDARQRAAVNFDGTCRREPAIHQDLESGVLSRGRIRSSRSAT